MLFNFLLANVYFRERRLQAGSGVLHTLEASCHFREVCPLALESLLKIDPQGTLPRESLLEASKAVILLGAPMVVAVAELSKDSFPVTDTGFWWPMVAILLGASSSRKLPIIPHLEPASSSRHCGLQSAMAIAASKEAGLQRKDLKWHN